MLLQIMILMLLEAPGLIQTEGAVTLTVGINNLKNQKGKLGLAVFRTAEGWPDMWEQAERSTLVLIDSKPQEIMISDLPLGRYAVSVFHDENSSGDMDKNFIGIPKEGYGVSNNAKAGLFGPPKFEDAQFDLSSNETRIDIEITY